MFYLDNHRFLVHIADGKAPPIEDGIFNCILYDNDIFFNWVIY